MITDFEQLKSFVSSYESSQKLKIDRNEKKNTTKRDTCMLPSKKTEYANLQNFTSLVSSVSKNNGQLIQRALVTAMQTHPFL